MVDADEQLAPVGQRPVREEAPAARAGRATRVEPAGQPSRCSMRDPPVEVGQLAARCRSACAGGPQVRGRGRGSRRPGASGACGGSAIGGSRRPVAGRRPVLQARLAGAARHLVLEDAVVRVERHRAASTVADPVGRLVEVVARRAATTRRVGVDDPQPDRRPAVRDRQHGEPVAADARSTSPGLSPRAAPSSTRAAAVGAPCGACSSARQQRAVLVDVAPLAACRRPRALGEQLLGATPRRSTSRTDRPVGLELGEGPVEQLGGPRRGRSGGPGWRPCCRSAGTTTRGRTRRLERQRRPPGRSRTNGDHSTMAWPTGSMPRRPARPVSWVYCGRA